jgi:OOP family OmpA-OmpF porin
MKKALMALGIVAAATALPAAAQQTQHFYAGVSLGQAKYNDVCSDLPGFSCDNKDTAFRLFGGYQFHRNIGVELGYADLGKAKFSGRLLGTSVSGEEEFSAFDLVAVGSWPIGDKFNVFGKLGMYHGEVKVSATASLAGLSATAGDSDSGSDFTYGLGAGFDFTRNLGARLEWQRYSGFSDAKDLDVFSLGLLYRFR